MDLTQTPERLKQSILMEAMQGKLTKQLPNDGTADELLQKIQQKKQDLIKAGNIRRHKKLPPINKNEILSDFTIPSNWKWVRLGSLVLLNSGLSYKKKDLSRDSSDIRVIRGGNISNDGRLLLKDNDYRISNDAIKNNDVILKQGQLLTPVSTSPSHIAKMAIVPKLNSRIAAGGFVYQITPYIKSHVFSKFLLYGLTYIRIKKEILKITHLSGSALCNLPKTKFIKILLPLPPLAEQKRIVQRLNQILPKIDNLNKDVVKLHSIRKAFPHRLKQSLLMEAMQGKLTQQLPSDGNANDLLKIIKYKKQKLIKNKKIRNYRLKSIDNNNMPFNVPSNWNWSRLGDVAFLNAGKNLNKYSSPNKSFNNDILYIKVADMNSIDNKISINNSHLYISNDKYHLPVPSIIFPKIGGAIKTNKRRKVLKTNVYIDPNIMSITPFLKEMFPFLWRFMKGIDLSKIQSGSAVPALSQGNVNNILIPVPPLAEQKRIVNKLIEMFNLF